MNRKLKYLLIILLNLISVTLIVAIKFMYNTFGNLTIEEIIFHLKVPLEGTDTTVIYKFLKYYVPIIIGVTALISTILIYPIARANKIRQKRANEAKAKKENIEIGNIEIKQVVIDKNAQSSTNSVDEKINEDIVDGQLKLDLDGFENKIKSELNESSKDDGQTNSNLEEQKNVERSKEYAFRVVKDDTQSSEKNSHKGNKKRVKKVVVKAKRVNTSIGAKIVISIVIFIISLTYTINTTEVVQYISNQLNESSFIENEYVNPSKVSLEFPEKKRNLIYIFLESMESSYSSKEEGGGMDVNLIPELTELAKENINFSNTDQIGGAIPLSGTTWTIAGMVAQTTGIPLKIGVEISNTGDMEEFLPGAYTIGDILEEEGYTNYLMIGSDSKFATRDKFFKAHGNYQIWDVNTAIEEGRMTESEKVWWGYQDKNLFLYAKEEISKLADAGEPFNFTMLTVDTHFPDGYLCEDCENEYSEKYYNVLSCSSKQVYEFVEWAKTQEFYENTTIVISGDHLTMQTGYFDNLSVERTVYNVIINSAVETENIKNRTFSTIDLFPTTLAAMGVKIEGDRLGLGTNLFSEVPTLMEQYGAEYVNNEFKKASSFYNKEFLNY